MVQERRDIFVILFGIYEIKVFCHVLSSLPEQISHDEQRVPDMLRLCIGIGVFELRPDFRLQACPEVFPHFSGGLLKDSLNAEIPDQHFHQLFPHIEIQRLF